MQTNKILGTDIEVSIIGLGTVKLGRNTGVKYPSKFIIPNNKEAIHILNTAGKCGINLIDTAPAYGNSEERLGKLLQKTDHSWVISTKVGEEYDASTGQSTYNFTPEHIQTSIENSLHRLQRDQLDIVLIHSNGNDDEIIENYGALDTLNHLKRKGLIRATGMSTKTVNGGILAVQHADIVMITHNLTYQKEVSVIEYAEKHSKNIFIKKALDSGHNTQHSADEKIKQTFDCIYKHQSISSIILGSINPIHIQKNSLNAIKSYDSNSYKRFQQ